MSVELELESLALLNITIKTRNGQVIEYNVGDELAVSKDDLDDAFIRQPGKYAWWATLAETAKAQRDHLEALLDRAEAEADYNVRLKMELEGVKITEPAVKRGIKNDETYQEALRKFNEAKKTAAIFDKIVKAFDHRLECIVNLSAKLRKEQRQS
jgi:hypothetical protein